MNYRIEKTEKINLRLEKSVKDTAPLMERIALSAYSFIVGRIERGIAPENAQLTKEIKRGNQTLKDNGRLVGSLHARHKENEASVSSKHIAAFLNNPDDDRTHYEITPKKAKSLAIPASSYTRTLMRKYGWSPREVLDGLRKDGYSVYRPVKKGSGNVRANVIMAMLIPKDKNNITKRGKEGKAKKWKPFAVFILAKKVRVPVRRFMYLTDEELGTIDKTVEEYFAG